MDFADRQSPRWNYLLQMWHRKSWDSEEVEFVHAEVRDSIR
jgi:hypothetical protein